jgi:thiamine biosynthesis lipoprotein
LSWWCVLGCFLAAGCAHRSDRVRRAQPLLGTYVVISARGENANTAVSAAFEEIRRIDALMSLHRVDSELVKLNARVTETVSEDLFKVLVKAREISELTDGSFDVTIRPLADLWGFIWKEYRLPTTDELASTLPKVDYRLVQLDPARRTVRFARDGVSIDLGGIAKGYAVDCAIEKLRSMGITNAMVRAGGDLRVMGEWTVQIEDPQKEGKRTTIQLKDAAISTSGDYENYFVIDGKRYSHILDPRTGLPVQDVAACTVIAPTCMESDALATGLFVYGPERTAQRFRNTINVRFSRRAAMPGTARGRR